MQPETPFDEDVLVCLLAERHDLLLSRYQEIEITDAKALSLAGMMRETPDYLKIRKALQLGHSVKGAQMGGGVRYTLKRRAVFAPGSSPDQLAVFRAGMAR